MCSRRRRSPRRSATAASLTQPVNDLGANAERDIVSRASTGTDVAEVSIAVYESPDVREDAQLEQADVCPGCAHVAECGPILVTIPVSGADPRVEELRDDVRGVLEDVYGPC